MPTTWEVWRGVSAAVAFGLVVILLSRHVLEAYIERSLRRAVDLVAAPLFALFVLYIITDFLRLL